MAAIERERRRKPTWRLPAITEKAAQHPRLVTGLLVAIITAATWPLTSLRAGAGIDPSWMLGLNLGATKHLQYGSEIDYTYGPLGYLTSPVLGALWPAALGVLFVLLVQVALVATLLGWTRPVLGTPTAAATTFAIATFTNAPPLAEVLPILVLGWCIAALCGPRDAPIGRLLLPALAGLAGLQLVIKFNIGLTSIAVVLICAWFFPPERWRSLGTAAASVLGGFLLGWLAALQNPLNIPSWLSTSWDIATVYPSAMNVDYVPPQSQYVAAFGLLLAVAWAVWTETLGLSRALRATVLLATAVCLYATFKHNYVRSFTMVDVFLACAILAFVPTTRTKRIGLACGICFGAILSLVAITGGPTRQYDPIEVAVRPFTNVLNLVDHSRRTEVRDRGAQAIIEAVGVDSGLRQRIGRSTVAIDPSEISVAWAYGLNWRPVPVIQPFSAYTASLDDLEADALDSRSGPRFILRRADATGVDNRLRALDTPAYFFEMLCRYRQIALAGSWALLERAPDRCGRPVKIRTVAGAAGTVVAVPDGGASSVIYARLSFSPSLWARFRELVFKPANVPSITVTRATDVASYRYLVETGESPNVLFVPATSGFGPGPLGGDLRARSIALQNVPSYYVTFYRVPFAG